jgi:glycosyltransferase involved in cell wall biosynthesis
MRIAIFSTCPAGVYSGGRYHALIAGYCLARRGHEVYFITDNLPVFDDDLRIISPDNPVTIIETKDFEIGSRLRFDHVIIAPQSTKARRLYTTAIRFAEMNQAALSFFCFESENWFNEVSPAKRPPSAWTDWHLPASRGALILCSAQESERYARDYFTDMHPESEFGVWQPAINQPALDVAQAPEGDGSILIFARPKDAHKGSDIVEQLLVPELRDRTIVIVIGNPRGSEDYCERITRMAEESGNKVDFRFGLTDVEKFAELKRAAALVFPSYFEGYGYPPIEALATDTHCIAYDLPVVRENCGDLVQYVAPGDVEALRDTLIAALASGPARTSGDERVVFRADIDIRARELETVLENYRKERDGRRVLSAAGARNLRCEVTMPDRVRLGDRMIHSFVVSASRRISAVAFKGGFEASAHVLSTICVNRWMLHQVVIETPIIDEMVPAWTGGTLYVSFGGDGGATIDLPTTAQDRGVAPPFDGSVAGVTQRYDGAGRTTLFCWALPDQAYDAALWISTGENGDVSCVLGETGLVTAAYGKKTGVTEKVDCGINFCFRSSSDLGTDNHLLLLRNGRVILSTAIPAEEIARATLREIREIGVPALVGEEAAAPALFRSQSNLSSRRAIFRAWTNAVDHPLTLEVHRLAAEEGMVKGTLVGRLPANALRPDAATQHGFPRADIGFSETLPPAPTYVLSLRGNDVDYAAIPRLKLDPDEGDAPLLPTKRLTLSLTEDLHAGSWTIVRRPFKRAVTKFAYDPITATMQIQGWVLASGNFELALMEIGSDEEIFATSYLKDRPDVAKKYGRQYLKSGIDLTFSIPELAPAGYALHIRGADGTAEVQMLAAPQLAGIVEFKVHDCRYDPTWSGIWVRGSFVCPGARLTGIEIRQAGELLATGVVNVKQMRHGDPLSGWRIEGLLDAPFDPALPVEVRGTTDSGVDVVTRFTPDTMPMPAEARPVDVAMASMGPDRTFRELVVPQGVDTANIVLLVVHNLDAIDRPEKLAALTSLRQALARQGLDLLLFHHCQNPTPADLPEISYFDPFFDLLGQMEGDARRQDVQRAIPQERLSAITGALYGFYASLGFSPRAWKDCIAQVDQEAQRLLYVLDALQPRGVLLWHQWNSLMDIGRVLSDSRGLPSAYLHEGMLPRTMTFDPQGMMAESGSVGALLNGAPDDAVWLDRADAVIARIRDEGLDRKPLSDIRVGSVARGLADDMGARLIFYAGINDWHSGNLPESGAAIHSPHFRDTMDGLNALVEAAEQNDWLIMFKPHPNLYPAIIPPHPRLFVVREGNSIDCIDAADATVSILSSITYIAAARGKPTVLLGRNTLSDTGAVQEISGRDDLVPAINAALGGLDAVARADAYRDHIAALLKDHLFVYDPDDSLASLSHDLLVDRLLLLIDPDGQRSAITPSLVALGAA